MTTPEKVELFTITKSYGAVAATPEPANRALRYF